MGVMFLSCIVLADENHTYQFPQILATLASVFAVITLAMMAYTIWGSPNGYYGQLVLRGGNCPKMILEFNQCVQMFPSLVVGPVG